MMDTKFCTACQVTRPVEGGAMKKSGKINRWVCKVCQDRSSVSPYLSTFRKGNDNAIRK